MIHFIIATRNAHKVDEIRAVLGAAHSYQTLRDHPSAPSVVEDAPDFACNASKKAVGLAAWLAAQADVTISINAAAPAALSKAFVLADDSGLEVDALNGAPGVYSARFAALDTAGAGNSSDAENNAKLLRLLASVPLDERTARFRCVIAITPVPHPADKSISEELSRRLMKNETRVFDGACEGRIGFAPKGAGGFGYDPLFLPLGFDQSFAELGEEIKNGISHRARALAKLKEFLESGG